MIGDVAHPQADGAGSIPRPVRRTTRAEEQRDPRAPTTSGIRKPSRSAPPTKPVEATAAFDEHRQRATEEERPAGSPASRAPPTSVCVPALVRDRVPIPNSAGHGRLHGVPDHEERVRLERARAAEVGEEDDLGVGPSEQHRDVDRRADPGEERAEADRAADEEDAEPGPTSARASRGRARAVRSSRRTERRSPCTRAPSPRQIAERRADPPPSAARRIARMPQVGASSQEIGLHPAGQQREREEQPGDDQIGYSSSVRERVRGAVEDERRGEQARAGRSRATAAGNETRTAAGATMCSGTPKRKRPQSSVAATSRRRCRRSRR